MHPPSSSARPPPVTSVRSVSVGVACLSGSSPHGTEDRACKAHVSLFPPRPAPPGEFDCASSIAFPAARPRVRLQRTHVPDGGGWHLAPRPAPHGASHGPVVSPIGSPQLPDGGTLQVPPAPARRDRGATPCLAGRCRRVTRGLGLGRVRSIIDNDNYAGACPDASTFPGCVSPRRRRGGVWWPDVDDASMGRNGPAAAAVRVPARGAHCVSA